MTGTQNDQETALTSTVGSQINGPIQNDLTLLRNSEFDKPLDEMKELFSMSRLAFIFGAGCSKYAGLPDMNELTEKVLTSLPSGSKVHIILEALNNNFSVASKATIEDLMSELVDWICIAKRRELHSTCSKTIPINGEHYSCEELLEALSEIKKCIYKHINATSISIDVHRRFVRAVHRTLQAGKTGRNQAIDYFILNYDTLLEDALGIEQIGNADGFSGGATGWWSLENYSDHSEARIFKVHGSIDWCLLDEEVFPRRLRPRLQTDHNTSDPILIWPSAMKYRESQRDPFAQILQMMRESLRPTADVEIVLGVCGYAFRDNDINFEIERALIESSGKLTLIVFTSEDGPTGQLECWLREESIHDQVRLYAKNGFYHGTKEYHSDNDLPWWKFESLTRLLEGQR